MKKFFDNIKLNSVLSGCGMASFAGYQYLFTAPVEMPIKYILFFLFSVATGTASKYIAERIVPKDH